MFDIGFSELLLFGVMALIILGPEKLPQAARTAGQWYGKLRRTVSTLQSEIEAELDLAETRQQMQKELAKIRQTEADMRREMAEMRGSMKEFETSQNESLNTDYSNTDYNYSNDYQNDKSTGEESLLDEDEDFTDSFDRYICTDDDFDSEESFGNSNEDSTSISNISNKAIPSMVTRPWENMWFRLGAYDKARRLPAPPLLPNYKADTLLQFNFSQPDLDAKMSPIEDEFEPSVVSLNKQEADK